MHVVHGSLPGAQFKALVEYAPSQQVPKSNIKKDARQGTITKGPKQAFLLSNMYQTFIFLVFSNLAYFCC